MLELDRLRKTFGATVALDGVTLCVAPGEMVGIIGRSGAGKSTLLRCVNRLVEPTSGTVRHAGTDVTALAGAALRRWRRDCAMVFQHFNLIPRLTVLDNVLVGRVGHRPAWRTLLGLFTAEDRALAVLALERVEMTPFVLRRAETLSGGQAQRVAIARALVQQPSMLLADEPIASLDPPGAARVMDDLRRANRDDGITVLCNLHSLAAARRYCDRVIGMSGGRIVFDGPADALDEPALQHVYGASATPPAHSPLIKEETL